MTETCTNCLQNITMVDEGVWVHDDTDSLFCTPDQPGTATIGDPR